MSKTVNIDYIAVIQQVNDHVEFIKKEITQKESLVNELKDMLDNPNRTVLDLKTRMDLEFIESERTKLYNFIAPYSYKSTYVDAAAYPKCISYDEYREDIRQLKEKTREEKERCWDYIRNSKPDDFKKRVEEGVESAVKGRVKELKVRFFNDAVRFSNAYCYTNLVNELKSDSSIKMYSTESAGWMTKHFEINEDVEITLNTNFGFGWSSYFFVNLCYKGIDILPYSYLVTYFYADKRDLTRYTRKYDESNTSWDYAFDFVENVTNKAKSGEYSFVNDFIRNEITEMMSGLRSISANPSAYLSKMATAKNKENPSHYLSVRNISDDEIKKYKAYPHEMTMVFEAEKLSSALSFIDNLRELEQIDNICANAIDEIISLAKNLLPRLERNISSIETDVERLKKQEEELEKEIETIQKSIDSHKKAIDAIYRHRTASGESIMLGTVADEYAKSHTEYDSLLDAKSQKEEKMSEIDDDMWARIAFQEQLEEFKSDIEAEEL